MKKYVPAISHRWRNVRLVLVNCRMPEENSFTSNRRARLPAHPRRAAQEGFALLEVILALGLFSLVAVGMTQALDQIAQTSKQARQEAQVLRVLESALAEVSHQPELKETVVDFPRSADGIDARVSVTRARLITRDKHELEHLFRVQAEAWMESPGKGGRKGLRRGMETYVYSPRSL